MQKPDNLQKTTIQEWCVSALLAFTALFFGPLHIYLGNAAEFSITLTHFAIPNLIVAAIGTVAFKLVLSLLRNLLGIRAVTVAFGFSVLLYIQGNLFVWDYGLLDGREIQWSNHTAKGVFEALVWVGVLLFASITRIPLLRYATVTSLALIAVQASAAMFNLSGYKALQHQLYAVDGRGLETFSAKENVILVVADAFQTTKFSEIIEKDPSFATIAEGFTYFRNATSGYSKTLGSIPNIVSGRYNRNEVPVDTLIRQMGESSVFGALKKGGFRVEVYPWIDKTIPFDPNIIDNIDLAAGSFETKAAIIGSIDLSLFRHAPHFAKPIINQDHRWLFSRILEKKRNSTSDRRRLSKTNGRRDQDFYERIQLIKADPNLGKTFKYIHLQGPHEPFLLDEDISLRRLPPTKEGFAIQARATLKILGTFLEKLKETGLYRNSTVVIVADHGGGEYRIPYTVPEAKRAGSGKETTVDIGVRSGGLPLILVKPAGADGKFEVCDSPVSLSDISKTIADLLKIPNSLPGEFIFSIPEEEDRTRIHYRYSFGGWQRAYLPKLEEYEINGFSWTPENWRKTGNVYDSGEQIQEPQAKAAIDIDWKLSEAKNYTFGAGGSANALLTKGWGGPEEGHIWSTAKQATLVLPIKDSDEHIKVAIELSPFVREKLTTQNVTISLGEKVLADWRAAIRGNYSFVIPKNLITGAPLDLILKIPNSASPMLDFRDSPDTRDLGIALHSLSIAKLGQIPSDLTLRFGSTGNAGAFQGTGWASPETSATWGLGAESSLQFAMPETIGTGSTYEVSVDIVPFKVAGVFEENAIDVFLNGDLVHSQNLSHRTDLKFPIRVHKNDPVSLVFRPKVFGAPAFYKNSSSDQRMLGARYYSMSIRALEE